MVLGGGFGGVYTARRLEKLQARGAPIEIALVSRDNFFLFTPMLHEVAASDLDLTHFVSPLRTLLRRSAIFVGDVGDVNLARRRVRVSHGFEPHAHELEYDHLVIALGSITNSLADHLRGQAPALREEGAGGARLAARPPVSEGFRAVPDRARSGDAGSAVRQRPGAGRI